MKVFVTGASGFLGSHVVHELLRRDHAVAVLLRPGARAWRLDACRAALRVVEGDLDEADGLAGALADCAPDAVVHAAWSGVGNRFRNDTAQVRNVEWGARLMLAAARAGARAFVGFGSQAEYGLHTDRPGEDAPARPTTVYGAAKTASFVMLDALAGQQGLRFAWARIFSTYGPGDEVHWMIPQLILALLRGERPALTPGDQQWDYCHARDAARAVADLVECEAARGAFNVGSGHTRSIREIATLLRDRAAPGAPLGFGEVPYRSDQVMHLQADIARLRASTGWTPQIPLETGLQETVDWYRDQRGRLW